MDSEPYETTPSSRWNRRSEKRTFLTIPSENTSIHLVVFLVRGRFAFPYPDFPFSG